MAKRWKGDLVVQVGVTVHGTPPLTAAASRRIERELRAIAKRVRMLVAAAVAPGKEPQP
jgi:hypothetical protein